MTIPFNPLWESEHLLTMPFDQYQRYRLAAELVATLKRAAGDERAAWKILDVGGYFPPPPAESPRHLGSRLPLPSFLPDDETLVVDTMDYEGPNYQRASGTGLPFPDSAFDVVLSCDTLEHIPPDSRNDFLAELRRVAGRAVILGAPHAMPGVRQAEYVLAEYLPVIGGANEMLSEHFSYGLPQPDLVDAWIAANDIASVAFVSGYLPRWQFMMLLKHLLFSFPDTVETHARLDQTYNQRFYAKDQRAPGYRRIYVLAAAGQQLPGDLSEFVERTALVDQADAAADMLGLLSIPLIQALSRAKGAVGGLERHLVDLIGAYQGVAAQSQALDQRYKDLVDHYQELGRHHQILGADRDALHERYAEALKQAALMEGEKRGLQEQLSMLTWQNQLLQQHLTSPSHRALGLARRLVDRVRRRSGRG